MCVSVSRETRGGHQVLFVLLSLGVSPFFLRVPRALGKKPEEAGTGLGVGGGTCMAMAEG